MSIIPKVPSHVYQMGAWNAVKTAASQIIPGAGDLMAAHSAIDKVEALDKILQTHFQSRGESFNNQDIAITDVKSAILYARGKKEVKAIRKGMIGGARVVVATATTLTGATVGSVIPVAGTAVGAAAGIGLGTVIGGGISAVDYAKRGIKKAYKKGTGTQGVHREQAAACLLHTMACNSGRRGLKRGLPRGNPAAEAVTVLLEEEIMSFWNDFPTADSRIERLAARMMSN